METEHEITSLKERVGNMENRVSANESRLKQNDEFRHTLRDALEALKLQVGILTTEFNNARKDAQDVEDRNDQRLQFIGRVLATASILLITLIGVLFAFLLQGGPGT